jgi:hypothetical protein
LAVPSRSKSTLDPAPSESSSPLQGTATDGVKCQIGLWQVYALGFCDSISMAFLIPGFICRYGPHARPPVTWVTDNGAGRFYSLGLRVPTRKKLPFVTPSCAQPTASSPCGEAGKVAPAARLPTA